MRGLSYTLLGDGPSDRLLRFPVGWALRDLGVAVDQAQWADLSFARPKPVGLADRAKRALELYPAELLVVHRDAEDALWNDRVQEIHDAVAERHVAVVPVRMTEAWLLHDEAAIRRASGNPKGKAKLDLPPPRQVENLQDPKQTLWDALLAATELTGRRRMQKQRALGQMRTRTAELIADFKPLLAVPAFQGFMSDLRDALKSLGYMRATR